MKNKKIIITALCVILVGAVGAVAYLALNSNNEVTTTSTTAVSETETTASLSGSVFNTTKKTTKATTADKNAFIRKGVWYLADEEKEECIAIAFKKNGKADVAFFNSDNIEGFDAQYFKGDASYDIRKNKIIFSKFPEVTGMANVELEISGKTIKYNNKELKQFKEISLDNALKCFND